MSVKDGGQKSTTSRPSKATKLNSPVSFKKQPWTAFSERNVSPSTDGKRVSLGSVRSVLARNSVGSSKSSLRSSTGSCHDACKFGGHGNSADSSAAAKFGGKFPAKKTGATKISKPAISKIAVVKSPVGSRNYPAPVNKSVTRTPRENPRSVDGRAQNPVNRRIQNGVQTSVLGSRAQTSVNGRAQTSINSRAQNSVNSRVQTFVNSRAHNSVNSRAHISVNSRESCKPSRASISTPEGKFKVARSLFRSPGMASKICDNDSIKWQSPVARSLLAAFESPSGDLLLNQAFEDYNCQILDDKSEEEFFRQYYSPCEPENASNSVINSSGVSEISFEAFCGDQFSEISSPRSLEATSSTAGDVKMRFIRGNKGVRDSGESNPGPASVYLRHQDMQERKDYLIDHVMEEAVSKLVHCEESKVKVLVGAFETVISLRDSHDAAAAAADHTRPLQACN